MLRPRSIALALVLTQLLACATPRLTATVAKTGAAGPTAQPGKASPAPAVRAASRGMLLAPKGESTSLQGQLVVDSSYLVSQHVAQLGSLGGVSTLFPLKTAEGARLVAQGAGNLISQDGGGLISQDGGGLISQDGGGLISQDGGGIVAQGAGNLVAQGAGNLVAQGAGNLIVDHASAVLASDAATLISQDGGSLISQDGGGAVAPTSAGLISQDGGGLTGAHAYHLADAATLASDRPAAGFALSAISLGNNRPLALGVDAAGKPVYVVYTDARGGYALHLPPHLTSNVRLVASIAGSTDPHARLEFLIPAGGGQGTVTNEAAALSSSCVLRAMASLLHDFITTGKLASTHADKQDITAPVLAAASVAVQAARDAGLDDLSPGRKGQFETLLSKHACIKIELAKIPMLPGVEHYTPAQDELANVDLEETFQQVRVTAGAMISRGVDFNTKPYVIAANAHRAIAHKPPFVIHAASDLVTFMIEEYCTSGDGDHIKLCEVVFTDLGLPAGLSHKLRSAYTNVYLAVLAYLSDDQGVQDLAKAARDITTDLKRGDIAEPAIAPPTPTVQVASVPQAERYTASTLLGSAGPGAVDGPAAQATVTAPSALRVGPDGNLYFLEIGLNTLRMVALGAPGQPVSTLLSGSGAGDNRTAGAAGLSGPDGLAIARTDAGLALYIAELGSHRISQVLLAPGKAPAISTLAGSGEAGDHNGPGATASFQSPGGLALDAEHHRLFVGDYNNHSVRSIDLADPAHPVSTLVGPGPDAATRSDPTYLISPLGLAFSQGRLAIGDADGSIRGVFGLLDGQLSLLAGRDKPGTEDGYFTNGHFGGPYDLAVDRDGSLLVADADGGCIRRVRLDGTGAGVVSTLAGHGGITPVNDKGEPVCPVPDDIPGLPGLQASFCKPVSLDVAADGTVYVGEQAAHRIRLLKPAPAP